MAWRPAAFCSRIPSTRRPKSFCASIASGGLAGAAHPLRRPDMKEQPFDDVSEIKRLQRCMSDLVSVLALSAVWSAQDPGQIAASFCDAIAAMLDLDFLYV